VPLERAVAAFGARTGGTLTGTALTDADPTGRPRGVALLGATLATIPVADFRRALGYDVVRSLWLRAVRIDATQAAPQLVIEGSGRGHGVGLCQWGARYFASSGASAADIVAFYFPGTALTSG
jgi:stage II sporulation protein D